MTAYVKKNTFKTITGEIDLSDQKIDYFWTVGQWQKGVFQGVEGTYNSPGKPVRLKTGW